MENLREFLAQAFDDYSEKRNRPDVAGTSRLSPHLHFGEISPRQIWHGLRALAARRDLTVAVWRNSQFLAEVGWREFAHHLLFHFPRTPAEPLRPQFRHFPWRKDAASLRAWQKGRTGYPIVDAGMRELWTTGWMHNRVRMIAAQFPRKGFAAAVAGRRAVVLGHARGRRPRAEHARLAVDRRLRRGRRAVFPYFQSRESGREIRSERRLRPPLVSRTREAAGRMVASSLGSAGGNFRASRHAARPRLSRTHHQPRDRARGGAGSLCQNKISLRLTNPTLTGLFAAAIASRGETSAASNRSRFVTQFNIVMSDIRISMALPVRAGRTALSFLLSGQHDHGDETSRASGASKSNH